MRKAWITYAPVPAAVLASALMFAACATQVDVKKKAAYLDEIASLGSLVLANPLLDKDQRALVRQRVDDLKADGEAHYK